MNIENKKEQYIAELAEKYVEDTQLAQEDFRASASTLFDLYAKEYLLSKLDKLEIAKDGD